MAKGGKEYRRVVGAFERIFGATIFFSTETTGSTSVAVQRGRFAFLKAAEIWYDRDTRIPGGENVITLSDAFYAELSAHPIPADLDAVKVFAAAPGLLDLFLWLRYRCFTAKGPEPIPLFGPYGVDPTARLH